MADKKFSMDDYVDVAQRITEFYERFPDGSLRTGIHPHILTVDGRSFIVYHAQAFRTPDDECPADGWAWEPIPGPTQFTRDSELMNAETAAWGRAIVACGFKTKKIASAQEVRARSDEPIEKPKWDEIDPGAVLHPDAPKGWTAIAEMQKGIDPGRDWAWIVQGILSGKYGVQFAKDLKDGVDVEVGRRLANMAGHLLMVEMQGKEFPPPSNEDVVRVIQWAFDGLTIDLDAEPSMDDIDSDHVELDVEALQAASADIEFGDAPA